MDYGNSQIEEGEKEHEGGEGTSQKGARCNISDSYGKKEGVGRKAKWGPENRAIV